MNGCMDVDELMYRWIDIMIPNFTIYSENGLMDAWTVPLVIRKVLICIKVLFFVIYSKNGLMEGGKGKDGWMHGYMDGCMDRWIHRYATGLWNKMHEWINKKRSKKE